MSGPAFCVSSKCPSEKSFLNRQVYLQQKAWAVFITLALSLTCHGPEFLSKDSDILANFTFNCLLEKGFSTLY